MDKNNSCLRARKAGIRFPKSPTILGLTLLMAAANFRSIDCKSMPINQLQLQSPPQQTHQMLPSKIPMIFLTKPQQMQSQLLQQPQQPQQQQQQYQPQDFRQGPNPMNTSTSSFHEVQTSGKLPMIMMAASTTLPGQAARHPLQRPEFSLLTSASHLSATRQQSSASRHGKQQSPDQQSSASVPSLVAAQAVDEQGDNADSQDDSDAEDEPSLPVGSKDQAAASIDSDDVEPTRRGSAASGRLEAAQSGRATIDAVTRQRYNGPHLSPASSIYRPDHHRARGDQPEAGEEASGAQVRKDQDSAEASEAEVADRSALDEQQQAQREIILAQAQSEAKAIKEQQEALLKQQVLLQQILRRQDELNANRSVPAMAAGGRGSAADRRSHHHPGKSTSGGNKLKHQQRAQPHRHVDYGNNDDNDNDDSNQLQQERRRNEGLVSKSSNQDEEADYSFRRPQAIARHPSQGGGSIPKYGVSDLLPAAQHSYGAHYAPLHGYQNDYYQFAESFKKGQFHSGFKRGGKKFQISGHASQHKSHAEGHVKWNGHKGKGVSYWNYQHGDKKHHGGPGYYH